MKEVGNLYFCEEIYKQSFFAHNQKDSYLKAVKWYATNVLSKNLTGVAATYEKKKDTTEIILHVIIFIDEKETLERHCTCCKELHHSFFVNENYDCNKCKLNAYKKRLTEKIKIKKEFCKSKIEVK